MKKLDLYIIRKFLTTFFFALMLFTIVAVTIDLTEKIDDLISNNVPLKATIFGYYFNFIPYIDAMLSPLFIFISVIFFTSRMAYKSEIIAVLASGVNFYRFLVPYFVTATLLAGMLLYANHFMVPNTNKKRLAFEYTYISNANKKVNRNLYMQVEKDKYIYMENYHPNDKVGYKFSYEIIRDGKLDSKLRADRIEWRKDEQKWRIKNFYIRKMEPLGEKIIKGAVMDSSFNFKPEDLIKRLSVKEEMNTIELKKYIDALKLRGAENIEFYQIELHRRTSDAFTVFILTLLGISIGSIKVRGGTGLHIVAGFLLSGTYVIFTRFSTTFATNANLSPFLSVWIPTIIFGILTVFLLIKTPK